VSIDVSKESTELSQLPYAQRTNMNTQQTSLNYSIGVPKEENFGPDSFEQYQAQKGKMYTYS